MTNALIQNSGARVVDGDDFECLTYPADETLLRVATGDLQVAEYTSEDRTGPPPHSHPWREVEYVIEGEVEFLVDGTWHRVGPGGVQVLPAGVGHSVRVPKGRARVLVVAIGASFSDFARDLAAVYRRAGSGFDDIVAIAERHGVRLTG